MLSKQALAWLDVTNLDNGPEETRDRILQATAHLMKSKGYKAVTTRTIAKEAGVNETTIFRHFGSKKGIVESLVEKYSYAPLFQNVLNHATWDLETDLIALAQTYQQFMKQHGDIVIIGLREAGAFDELDEKAADVPKAFKQKLTDYLLIMKEKKLLLETDLEAQAMTFIWMNLGFFISKSLYGERITTLNTDVFLQNSVKTFARGLTP
jgi:AcrR family transcriptional regulator